MESIKVINRQTLLECEYSVPHTTDRNTTMAFPSSTADITNPLSWIRWYSCLEFHLELELCGRIGNTSRGAGGEWKLVYMSTRAYESIRRPPVYRRLPFRPYNNSCWTSECFRQSVHSSYEHISVRKGMSQASLNMAFHINVAKIAKKNTNSWWWLWIMTR
jgi:hypothetical protein